MLTLEEIRSFYPEPLHRFSGFLLREYLQYKILEILYEGPHATNLCFLGGTCLRIVHGNRRFSEDLDFDNLHLEPDQFEEIAVRIQKELQLEGYDVEMKTAMRGAWHCYIRFPGLLFESGLSGHREEKILIQLDTEPQAFDFEPERVILNRFDVFTTLLTVPLPLLMAQKLYALLNRHRSKGRDFYDVIFLMSKQVVPEYNYLNEKLSIGNAAQLKEQLLERCNELSMETIARDVEPFLFDVRERRTILQFPELVEQYPF